MAKKTITKEHPITAFRKANEARQSIVKKSLIKAQNGISYNGSQLANEYAKAPMAGAEPAWSAIELEKQNAKGPRTGLNTYVSPYNQSNTIYTNSKGVNTNTQGSNVMNDPRFSNAMEKTNTFYNKEKQAGTLNTKGFNKRYNAAKDLDQKGINTINSQKKKGGTVKSKKK